MWECGRDGLDHVAPHAGEWVRRCACGQPECERGAVVGARDRKSGDRASAVSGTLKRRGEEG